MAPLATPRRSAGLAVLHPCGRSIGVRREPGAAVARQGLRAAGPGGRKRARVPKVSSQLRAVDTPRAGQCSRSAALLHVRRASPRGALRAPLKTYRKFSRHLVGGRVCCPA